MDFWTILKAMNYYFMTYIYIWVPLIIGLLIFAWYWDKKHERFLETRNNKYVFKVLQKNGLNRVKTIVTNKKDFFVHKETLKLYDNFESTKCKLCEKNTVNPTKGICETCGLIQSEPIPAPPLDGYHITPACSFGFPKDKWEPLYNNWFHNRIPLRFLKRVFKSWNWYRKYICFFTEKDDTVVEGFKMSDGKPLVIAIAEGAKTGNVTAQDIKILFDTNLLHPSIGEVVPNIVALLKRFGLILIVVTVAGIVVYLYMTGAIKV